MHLLRKSRLSPSYSSAHTHHLYVAVAKRYSYNHQPIAFRETLGSFIHHPTIHISKPSPIMSPKFAIPEEYQHLLRHIELTDQRTDNEVLKTLEAEAPVTSEKNVWAFWDTGISKAPAWCQRNVASWVRMNSAAGWTVRVLNLVKGSASHWSKFVPAEMLPTAFVEGRMDGPYAAQHSADLLRGAVLYQHGGIFLDVSCMLFRSFDRICWERMQRPERQYGVAHTPIFNDVIQNSFFAARKGNVFIQKWHELFVTVWSAPPDRTNYEGLTDHPLLEFAKHVDLPVPPIGLKVPLSTFKEYVTQILCWRRVCRLSAPEKDGLDLNRYWQEHVLPISMMHESWGLEDVCGWSAERAFQRLTAKMEPPPPLSDNDNEKSVAAAADYQESWRMVWRMLSQSSMEKFFNGKQLLKEPALGSWFSAPENAGKDCEPGTFVELLRYGAEHFEQAREEVELVPLGDIDKIPKGLLEP